MNPRVALMHRLLDEVAELIESAEAGRVEIEYGSGKVVIYTGRRGRAARVGEGGPAEAPTAGPTERLTEPAGLCSQ